MDQINIFDMLFPKYKITKPVRLIEVFAGIGSQERALKRLQKKYKFKLEVHRVIEYDKYAMKSYNAIRNTNFEPSDITKTHAENLGIVDTDKYVYIMTYSFPCQDLSLAGNRKGMKKGSNTRSGLLWEIERILDEIVEVGGGLPQILLMENVPQVISSVNMNDFHLWQKKLEDLGYSNYVSLLNAKDYGIPQNRNRCFMISILGQYNYSFPKPFELKLKLKDLLEDEVDEKYYLSEKMVDFFKNNSIKNEEKGNGFRFKPSNGECVAKTITTLAGNRMDDNFINTEVFDFRYDDGIRTRVDKRVCPTLTCKTGSAGISGQPLLKITRGVMIHEATKKGYAVANEGDYVNLSYLYSKTRRGRVGKQCSQTLLCNDNNGVVIGSTQKNAYIGTIDGSSPTLTSAMGSGGGHTPMIGNNLKIRKLTPLECWRLMGFDDEDFYKAQKVNSNSQLYKQAGNSIVVDVLYYIFNEFFV